MFQFLKGTIRPSNRGGFNLQQVDEFQFLKGTIRQLKWRAAPSTSKSFNSSKVRYDFAKRLNGLLLQDSFNSSKVRYDKKYHKLLKKIYIKVSIPQRYDTTTVNTAS